MLAALYEKLLGNEKAIFKNITDFSNKRGD